MQSDTDHIRSDEDVLAEANGLAAALAAARGYETPEGHQFHADPNPIAQMYWDLAAVAFEHLRATDINDTLANLGIERPDPKATLPGMQPPRRRRQRPAPHSI